MTYLSVTQFETRHRLIEAELEREHARAAGRRVGRAPAPRPPLAQGRPGRRRGLGAGGASDGRAHSRAVSP